ncbi:MAG TPA: RcpC/CpaB family pilus assembly protein [Aeromicrobium sp.]|nr:RcpC/CpaB family pilus assembly protein [Aeromicrobium sp.]
MKRKVFAILFAILFATIGSGLLVLYAESADERALGDAELVDVIQVTKTIDAGTNADELGDSVKRTRLPRIAVVRGAVDDLDEIDGLSSITDLHPGDQIVRSRFARDGVVVGDAEATLPKGYQELTIPLTQARIVGGLIKPGDRVGVYGSDEKEGEGYTTVIEHQVLVMRVRVAGATRDDGATPTGGGPEGGNYLVTLAVKTQGAIFDIGFHEFGKVYLTKQNRNTEKGPWPELAKLPFGQLRSFVELARSRTSPSSGVNE